MNTAYPEHMDETALVHIEAAFGKSTSLEGRRISVIGSVENPVHQLIGLRSPDIPIWTASKVDIGLCGSDWILERELQLGIKFVHLASFRYGRHFFTEPKDEIVASEGDSATNIATMNPGVLVGEYPYLMKKACEENGWEGKIAQLGLNGAPGDPMIFERFCKDKGLIGIQIAHGGIPEMVRTGGVYGFMVSETNGTKEENGLKVLGVTHEIYPTLITTKDTLSLAERELMAFSERMEYVYNTRYKEKPQSLVEGMHGIERG